MSMEPSVKQMNYLLALMDRKGVPRSLVTAPNTMKEASDLIDLLLGFDHLFKQIVRYRNAGLEEQMIATISRALNYTPPVPQAQCQGTTKEGNRCKSKGRIESPGFCLHHSSEPQCEGVTVAGERCMAKALKSTPGFCFQHAPQKKE